jgi:hypothetical protein
MIFMPSFVSITTLFLMSSAVVIRRTWGSHHVSYWKITYQNLTTGCHGRHDLPATYWIKRDGIETRPEYQDDLDETNVIISLILHFFLLLIISSWT